MCRETKKLKVGIYSPYLHILGGGERYLLTIAKILSSTAEVFIFSDESIKKKARVIFDISLNRVHFLSKEIFRTKKLFNKYLSLRDFDIFFYMTDGSLFFPFAKKNFLIIQSPAHIPKLFLLNRLKLSFWSIICYSQFMRQIITDRLSKEAKVLPPCVDVDRFRGRFEDKENIILTVGRFFPYPHNKKHDLLIDVFKTNYKKYFNGWRLIIAGGFTEEAGQKILNRLKTESNGFPIEILINLPFTSLRRLYSKAKLYWHAAGFQEDIKASPEKAEHFGITTLEAMAGSVVPLVFKAGGQEEIVTDGKNGYYWTTEEEFVRKTYKLTKDSSLLCQLANQAKVRAADYSDKKFYERLEKIIS